MKQQICRGVIRAKSLDHPEKIHGLIPAASPDLMAADGSTKHSIGKDSLAMLEEYFAGHLEKRSAP